MAGFKKGEPYRLERGLLELPNSIAWYEKKLFGNRLTLFRAEAASAHGDKSTCASNFLNCIIPWFVEVLVQDGIYFIVDFPQHNVSRWLRVRPSQVWFLTTFASHFVVSYLFLCF